MNHGGIIQHLITQEYLAKKQAVMKMLESFSHQFIFV